MYNARLKEITILLCSFTAKSHEDYLVTNSNITFVYGQSSDGSNQQCLPITIYDDSILEDTENFTLLASDGSGVVNLVEYMVTVIIQEDAQDSK